MTKSLKIKGLQILVLIIITILIVIGYRRYKIYRYNKIIDKYSQVQNWQDAKELFESDLKNNDLKYFFFGLAYNKDFDSIKRKYDLDVIFRGDIVDANLNEYNYFVESEVIKKIHWSHRFLTFADSFWTRFEIALETKQIEYLISNSFDTLYCPELIISNVKAKGYYESKFIFEKHIDKIKYLNLSTRERDYFKTDSLIKVKFKVDNKEVGKEEYNLIFNFEKKGDKYLFHGMTKT